MIIKILKIYILIWNVYYLPYEVQLNILIKIGYPDLIFFSQTCSLAKKLCNDRYLWQATACMGTKELYEGILLIFLKRQRI